MAIKPIKLTGEQKKVLFLPTTEPIQIKGVAGSGKTTVALYRAKHLIDTHSDLFLETKVAIFTYNKTLVKYLKSLAPFVSGGYQKDSDEINPTKPKGLDIFITNFHSWAYRFIESNDISLRGRLIDKNTQQFVINDLKSKYSDYNISNKSDDFFIEEISWMKGKIFKTREEYLEAKRTGRGTNDRITKADKEIIWEIFNEYNIYLKNNNLVDFDDYALISLDIIENNPNFIKPFSHIVVDEAQDLNKAQILVITKLVADETKSISILADAAQRIYKSGFSWNEVGLNVRGGRTIEFKKNYRNTVQIIKAALSLLENESDKSEFTTVETAIKGENKPILGYFNNWNDQCEYILEELKKITNDDDLGSTAILHKRNGGLNQITYFLQQNGYNSQIITKAEDISFKDNTLKVCTLSSVKGLEFDNVFIINLDENVIPHPQGFVDEEDDFHISTERRLLYTAMTRAKKKLYLLSCNKPTRYLSEINKDYVEIIDKR